MSCVYCKHTKKVCSIVSIRIKSVVVSTNLSSHSIVVKVDQRSRIFLFGFTCVQKVPGEVDTVLEVVTATAPFKTAWTSKNKIKTK